MLSGDFGAVERLTARAVLKPVLRAAPIEIAVVLARGHGTWHPPRLVASGGRDSVDVTPATVLRPVLALDATAYVLAHNHLGDLPPGIDDLAVTRRLVAASAVVGLPLVSHLVVGPRCVWECVDPQAPRLVEDAEVLAPGWIERLRTGRRQPSLMPL